MKNGRREEMACLKLIQQKEDGVGSLSEQVVDDYLEGLATFLSSGNLNVVRCGMESPNKNPHGLSESMWSKITLTIAVNGMDKNIPGIPHKAPPAMTTTIETRALILTREPTNFGRM